MTTTPQDLEIALEEIQAIVRAVEAEAPEKMVPLFGAVHRLLENAANMAGDLELELKGLGPSTTRTNDGTEEEAA